LKAAARFLAAALFLSACALWGFFVHRNRVFPYRILRQAYERLLPVRAPHRFHVARRGEIGSPEAIDQLARLPYLQGYRSAGEKAGVRVFDRTLAQDGLNLVTSGESPVVTLMDMDGSVVKTWTVDASKVFPGLALSGEDVERDRFIRCAVLLADGGLLALVDQIGLVRLDAAGRLVWAYRGRVHHWINIAENGHIWVLSRQKRSAADLGREGDIWEDFVEELSPEGKPLSRISLFEALRRSPYSPLLTRPPPETDIFHTNSLQVLDGTLSERSPAFRKGNILVSLHTPDILAILDPGTATIVWALTGQWRSQHSAWLLPTGRILLFDNLGTMRAASRVLEVDPFTQQVAWSFAGRPGEGLLSETSGRVQRLPGGNTLIVESNFGRALETTPDGQVVWEWVNPNRAGKKKELVATLYHLERVPRDQAVFKDAAGPSGRPADPPR
jgi:arylsulfotransferase ASST